jgi:L-ascorbate metabolism protein UlaG (beta-lactamase superfamily)
MVLPTLLLITVKSEVVNGEYLDILPKMRQDGYPVDLLHPKGSKGGIMNRAQTSRFFVILLGVIMGITVMYGQKQFPEDVVKTSEGEVRIVHIGHGSLMFSFAGKVIHVDPAMMVYPDYASLPKADLILVTHEHGDHLDAKAIDALRTADTVIVSNAASAKTVADAVVMNNGDKQTFAGIPIEAVPAYNPEKQFHPRGNGNGYVLTFGDKRVYVAGDTENIPEMKALKGIDVAFLPMNQPFTMTPEQVADAAKVIRPAILYPYHYRFGESDPDRLVDLLKNEPGIEVRLREQR